MNTGALVLKTLRDLRAATLSVGATTVLMAMVVVLVFPSYAEQLADIEFPAVYEAFFGEAPISSPEGFASAEFFSWIPLLIITLAIIGGTAAIAGEEAAGTLDGLLALPVRRRDVLLAKAAGNALALVAATVVAYPAFALVALFVDFPIDWRNLWFAVLGLLPVSFLYLALSLLGSASFKGRGSAAIFVIALVVFAYVLNTIGAAVSDLEDIRKVSPFYWAEGSHVLVHGFQWERTAGLLALSGLVLWLAVLAFERRDIGASGLALPWVRRRRAPAGRP